MDYKAASLSMSTAGSAAFFGFRPKLSTRFCGLPPAGAAAGGGDAASVDAGPSAGAGAALSPCGRS